MRKHWTEAVKAENERLKAELAEARMAPMLREFSRAVSEGIMLQLVNMPYDEWPDLAKRAFEHERQRTPTPAFFWKSRLR
jgi:hypothetical protein